MSNGNSKSVYEIVTERIIAAIEAGVSPWRKPWTPNEFSYMGKPVTSAVNAVTGKPYRGINVLLLGLCGYADPRFLTFNQAKALGGNVKKGERGTPIVFWKWVEVSSQDATDEAAEDTPTGKRVPILRYYTVFNVEQCEGLEKLKPLSKPAPATAKAFNPIAEAEAILAGRKNPPTCYHGRNAAAYSPLADEVYMPAVQQFESMEAYYATRFHEEGHATGHVKRLGRPFGTGFGSDSYAREELVAELTAAFLCAEAGIDSTLDQSAAYLKGWLKPLKNDPKFVVIAAGQAQKAADYILSRSPEAEE
jgi:antirestriction protein ArdC